MTFGLPDKVVLGLVGKIAVPQGGRGSFLLLHLGEAFLGWGGVGAIYRASLPKEPSILAAAGGWRHL